MQLLIFYTPPFILLSCCFYGKIKEEFDKYKLEKISDGLVEIDNSEITTNSIRAICLVDNASDTYQLNDDNRVNTSIPYDNIIIEQ